MSVSKPDGSLRICIDYRALKKITIKDKYPLPRIDKILDNLNSVKFFSTLYATSGYYQIAMAERDKEKTAFAWRNELYDFNRMPFGFCNAPATFQRYMDKVFRKKLGIFVIPYLDDIIIYFKSIEDHKDYLKLVVNRLKSAGVRLNKKKCHFFKTKIKVLENIVTEGCIKPDPGKVKAIREYPAPNTIKELRSFLGTVSYCRRFIVDYALIVAPLNNLLKGKTRRSTKRIS